MKMLERLLVAALAALWSIHGVALSAELAQDAQGQGSEQAVKAQAAAEAQSDADLFPPDRIEQLVAPVALYPDALLAQVLMASTYPLDVVQASRWRKDNEGLAGKSLEEAAADQPWDESVKALLFFPDVLTHMNGNLDWTKDLGDAVLGQQDDVMDAAQMLRREAMAAGNLQTTERQRVEVAPGADGAADVQSAGDTIIIQSADPEVVYVPSYNPSTVYGQAAPPVTTYYPQTYTTPTTSYVTDTDSSGSDSLVSFGAGALAGGLLTAAIMWDNDDKYDRIYYGGPGYYDRPGYWSGNNYWNGGYRQPGNININRSVTKERGDINISHDRGDVTVNQEIKKWEHNPERRGGVRYRNKETKQKFSQVQNDRIDRDRARGRDPNRKQPEYRGGARPQRVERTQSGAVGLKRPAATPVKRPVAKPAARPVTKQAKAPQRRDVKLNKPKIAAKRPAAKPPVKKAQRPIKRSTTRTSTFKTGKGSAARAASNRGAKSRGARHAGGGRASGGGRRR